MIARRFLWVALWLGCANLMFAAQDTPSKYLGNNQRTGYSDAEIPDAPALHWTYTEKHPPRHAWKEPNREQQYIDFDYVTNVAVGSGLVLFGSSADHKVYALDSATGAERWDFYTEGPVRFAPVIAGDRVYAASDDGHLYCLETKTGRLVWKFRGGPSDGKLIGNEQMISHWPARSGVLAEGDRLYFTAGMWSRDGVYVYCLNATDGSVRWKNDTAGFHFTSLPHASGLGGVAPQGYLALHRGRLYVPTGRGAPAFFNAATGEFLFYENGQGYKPHQEGGSRVMAWKDWVIFKRRAQHYEESVRYEERLAAKGAASGLYALDVETGQPQWSLTDKNVVSAHGDTMLLGGEGPVIKVDMSELMAGYQQYWKNGKQIKEDRNIPDHGLDYAWPNAKTRVRPAWMSPLPYRKWEADVGRVFVLLRAGNKILAGGREQVSLIDFDTGDTLWKTKIEGDARGICAAGGQFIVSSTAGKLYCFASGTPEVTTQITHRLETPVIDDRANQQAAAILENSGIRAGFALMLGAGDGQLLCALLQQSELVIYCLEPDQGKARQTRDVLDRAGLLGVRAAVHQGALDQLPYNPYLANLVVWGDMLGSSIDTVNGSELHRVLRPYGGVACQLANKDTVDATRQWLLRSGIPEEEVSAASTGLLVVRGALPGAGQWTHAYANIGRTGCSEDSLARLPLGMLWWGGPGPSRTVSRHWRSPVPLFSNGILYIQGQHDVIAVDAYNGREMWNRHIQGVGRFPPGNRGGNIVADDDSVYCVSGTTCLRLDAQSGKTLATYNFPLESRHRHAIAELETEHVQPNVQTRIVWEYLGVSGDFILGSLGSEKQLDDLGQKPYDVVHQARYLFAFHKTSGAWIWERKMDRAVSPMAMVADTQRVYYLDRTDERLYKQKLRRGEAEFASVLKAIDLATGHTLWEEPGVPLNRKALILKDDVLVAYPNPHEHETAEGDSGVAVYATDDGNLLWVKDKLPGVSRGGRSTVVRHTFVVGDTLYLPWAYDLRTGEEKLVKQNPFTGKRERFGVFGQNFCGTVSAACNLLAYRSASVGFQEISRNSGSFWLPEVRPSCWISVVPAGGIVLAPEGAATCICPYNYKTSVALLPVDRYEDWAVYLSGNKYALQQRKQAKKAVPLPEIEKLYANLNAPGDHSDSKGQLWMAYPRPINREFNLGSYLDTSLPIDISGVENGFRYNADSYPITGTEEPWLFTSGVEGPLNITIQLSGTAKRNYRVELLFVETETDEVGQRVFDVKIQGRIVLPQLDIAARAGQANHALRQTFEGIAAQEAMTIELVPVQGKAPRICSLSIQQEGQDGQ